MARAWGAGTSFGVRAGLELGHLHRRSGELEAALEAYAGALVAEGGPARLRDEAGLWSGRTHASARRFGEARRVLRRVAERAVEPWDRVAAFDHIGLTWIAEGDLEAAAGTLRRCVETLAPWSSEDTPTGARVRGAIERMRLVRALQEAIGNAKSAQAANEEHRETLDKMKRLFHRVLRNP